MVSGVTKSGRDALVPGVTGSGRDALVPEVTGSGKGALVPGVGGGDDDGFGAGAYVEVGDEGAVGGAEVGDGGAFGHEDGGAEAAAERAADRDVELAEDGAGQSVPDVGRAAFGKLAGNQGPAASDRATRDGADGDVPAGAVGDLQQRGLRTSYCSRMAA